MTYILPEAFDQDGDSISLSYKAGAASIFIEFDV